MKPIYQTSLVFVVSFGLVYQAVIQHHTIQRAEALQEELDNVHIKLNVAAAYVSQIELDRCSLKKLNDITSQNVHNQSHTEL